VPDLPQYLGLTCLTPVHVGTGTEYVAGVDFIARGNNTYLLDSERVLEKLYASGQLPRDPGDLKSKVERMFERERPEDCALARCSGTVGGDLKVRAAIRAGDGRPIIPGSSLKGALRTLIFVGRVGKDGPHDGMKPSLEIELSRAAEPPRAKFAARMIEIDPTADPVQNQGARRVRCLLRLVQDGVDPLATSQGSVQILANHHVFVGWGSSPHFSEFTANGTQLFAGSFRGKVVSYRAYRFSDWVGDPQWPPAIAVRKARTAGHANLYVSWNGSTRVRRWRVLGSTSVTGPFTKVRPSVHTSSFQTEIYVSASKGPYFELQALNSRGTALPQGTSQVIKAP